MFWCIWLYNETLFILFSIHVGHQCIAFSVAAALQCIAIDIYPKTWIGYQCQRIAIVVQCKSVGVDEDGLVYRFMQSIHR